MDIKIDNVDILKPPKQVVLRLNAPEQNWKKFNHELLKLEEATIESFSRVTDSIDLPYCRLMKSIDVAARISLGKTTIKVRTEKYDTDEIKILRAEKRSIKNELKMYRSDRAELIMQYKEKQCQIRDKILIEKTSMINMRFNRMLADKSKTSFWKALKKITRSSTNA